MHLVILNFDDQPVWHRCIHQVNRYNCNNCSMKFLYYQYTNTSSEINNMLLSAFDRFQYWVLRSLGDQWNFTMTKIRSRCFLSFVDRYCDDEGVFPTRISDWCHTEKSAHLVKLQSTRSQFNLSQFKYSLVFTDFFVLNLIELLDALQSDNEIICTHLYYPRSKYWKVCEMASLVLGAPGFQNSFVTVPAKPWNIWVIFEPKTPILYNNSTEEFDWVCWLFPFKVCKVVVSHVLTYTGT